MTHGTIFFPFFFLLKHIILNFSPIAGCRHPENGNMQIAVLDPFT